MIILDTNVLSELMKGKPNVSCLRWFESQVSANLFTTSVSQAEIYYGVYVLPAGKRRSDLLAACQFVFEQEMIARVLPFDNEASTAFAQIVAHRRLLGKPISQFDAQIAGIVRTRGAKLATRKVADFENCGVDVLNPWNE